MSTVRTEHIYVEKTPGVCGGEPIIAGTRIPARILFQRISSGDKIEDIHHSYPHLTLAQIYDALSYCYDHIDEINISGKKRLLIVKRNNKTPY